MRGDGWQQALGSARSFRCEEKQCAPSTHRRAKGDFAGIKPLGNTVRIEMAAFYTFDAASEKLIAEKIYYDQASALQQMQGNQIVTAVA
jgi:hypothetical protein